VSTKIKIALSALFAVAFSSTAPADGAPHSRIGGCCLLSELAARQPTATAVSASALNRHTENPITAAEKTLFERPLGSW
jgi:hypothetical protein